MPKLNRSKTSYEKLPESMQSKSVPDAKLSASITVTVPKGMEKKAEKYIAEAHNALKEGFKAFVKKEIRKHEKKTEENKGQHIS